MQIFKYHPFQKCNISLGSGATLCVCVCVCVCVRLLFYCAINGVILLFAQIHIFDK